MACQLLLEVERDKLEADEGEEQVRRRRRRRAGVTKKCVYSYLDKSYWSRVFGSVTKHSWGLSGHAWDVYQRKL